MNYRVQFEKRVEVARKGCSNCWQRIQSYQLVENHRGDGKFYLFGKIKFNNHHQTGLVFNGN